MGTRRSGEQHTYRLAKDMWQVKHLNGLTLVSANRSQSMLEFEDESSCEEAHASRCVVPGAHPW